MNADQAKATADMLAAVWEGEFPATCQVLAAVNNGNIEYRPDAKSRTARQLATHLATADIWFLECIADGAFQFDPNARRRPKPSSTASGTSLTSTRRRFPRNSTRFARLPRTR